MHAVYATLADHSIVKGFSSENWGEAIAEWYRLDDLRREGKTPHVRHFEVRDVTDPKYAEAPSKRSAFLPVITPRGFKWPEDAAKRAWNSLVPEYKPRNPWGMGKQGYGGWYYNANGTTVAQGLADLARICRNRGLIVEGQDGKWYVTEAAAPAEQTAAVA